MPAGFEADSVSLRGVRAAIDVGAARIGVAVSDPDGILATPLQTVVVSAVDSPSRAVAEIIAEREPIRVYIGLPRTLAGQEGAAAAIAREFASTLAADISVPIYLVDERLTTVVAHQALHRSGVKMKGHRSVVDQQAAVEILQHSLEVEKSTGRVPGIAVCASKPDQDETEAQGR